MRQLGNGTSVWTAFVGYSSSTKPIQRRQPRSFGDSRQRCKGAVLNLELILVCQRESPNACFSSPDTKPTRSQVGTSSAHTIEAGPPNTTCVVPPPQASS